MFQEIKAEARRGRGENRCRVPVHKVSSFPSVDSRSRFHLPIGVVERIVEEIRLVFLNPRFHGSLGLANVERGAIAAGNRVDRFRCTNDLFYTVFAIYK